MRLNFHRLRGKLEAVLLAFLLVGASTLLAHPALAQNAATTATITAGARPAGQLEWLVSESLQREFQTTGGGIVVDGKYATLQGAGAVKQISFTQVSGGVWNPANNIGEVHYYGSALLHSGTKPVSSVAVRDPRIISADGKKAVLTALGARDASGAEKRVTIAELDLAAAKPKVLANGVIVFASVPAQVAANADAAAFFAGKHRPGHELAALTFSVGNAVTVDAAGLHPAQPGSTPTPAPPDGSDDSAGQQPAAPADPPATDGNSNPAGVPGFTGKAAVGSLTWGVRETFRYYLYEGPAHGFATVDGEYATRISIGAGRHEELYRFTQAPNTKWDAVASTGAVEYAGVVNFKGHQGVGTANPEAYALDVSLVNPRITSRDGKIAVLSVVNYDERLNVAELDLASAKKTIDSAAGTVTYTGVAAKLTSDGAKVFFQGFYPVGEKLQDLTFVVGSAAIAAAAPVPDTKITAPTDTAPTDAELPKPVAGADAVSQNAGSLVWGTSTSFARYVGEGYVAGRATLVNTGGRVTARGVCGSVGEYVFPQSSRDFDFNSETGTVAYSGIINFWAHHGRLNQSLANPVIKVLNQREAELYVNDTFWGLIDLNGVKKIRFGNKITWQNAHFVQGSGANAFLKSDFDSKQRIRFDQTLSFTVGDNGTPAGCGTGGSSYDPAAKRQAASEAKQKEALAKAAEQAKQKPEAKKQQTTVYNAQEAAEDEPAQISYELWLWLAAGVLVVGAAVTAVAAARRLK
ncbi:cell envelope integrity protein TolA [Canibacter sp. lx-72]|uniref:HtaA domain-containing protein n=1 Tax=Canibacter zhuwentaonis TaxID=2837491 RepID=UPI001BDBD822|nr:HtaA domain-containing protein [Canibacter zhuwentaonis]MBT1018401.1 cell envelope integrity protein TolA [Canibacter zhuwentaonis]MBT1018746.1 cell envelope integrity protein TolA [Canibacter zhuwentaonis]